VARPRKPDDPERRRETPCDRCGGGYYLVASWGPHDQICGYCYQQAKRTRGTCACGHIGVLPGRIDNKPACRKCSGITLNIDCVRCGAEDELYRTGLCWPCALSDVVDRLLTNPETGVMATELEPLADALKSMKRANSGMTWIRQKHVTDFLKHLAVHPTITHDTIDGLPRSRTRDYVRGLLVEHGALPRRDETKVRYREWAQDALDRLTNEDYRVIIDRYVRWQHLRRMNEMETVSQGTFLRSKQTVTVAINFLNWIHERQIPLEDLQQGDVDDWVGGGPTTRLLADRFLNWAMSNRLAPAGLKVPRHRRGTSRKLSAADQDAALTEVVDGKRLSVRDRAAAILVLVFGQQLQDVVALTWDDVTVTEDLVTVRLGGFAIALNDPLDLPLRELMLKPGHDQTAAHPNSNWVFRGHSPGQHIDAMSLRDRLRRHVFSTRAARLGTLHELTKLAPVAIIADALGYNPKTIETHATASGADYAGYVAAVLTGDG
jgi:integrase